jgi:Tol biopolymer transport system component
VLNAVRPALLLVLLLAAFAAPLCAAFRYDPRFRFRTITTPRFFVHFHQGEEAQARRLARIAEEVAARLEAELGPPDGRVHVILVDQTDLANGWATPVPFNVIEITAAAPPAASIIANTDDWLRLVFTHEYTHVVHLSRKRGWIGGLRRVFGRQPLLYPNLFQPLWQIEGIATYAESAHTGEGRVTAGDFQMIVARAAAADRFEPIDRANGGLVDWPSGNTPYLYGGHFHRFLADRYGAPAIRRLTDETAGRLPYFGSRAYTKVFGKPLGTLWREFEAEWRRDSRLSNVSATRLTYHGYSVRGPRFASDGRIYYSISNPDGFPALMALDTDSGKPRHVVDRFLGDRVSTAGPWPELDREPLLVYDQVEYVRNVGLQSDLYAVAVDGRRPRRLTVGARAADPDVSPDGRTIVCTVQGPDRRTLATMAMPPVRGAIETPAALVNEANVDFASPRWSPDGRWIAAERRQLGGASEIVLVDPRSGSVRALPAPGTRNASPAWTPDGVRVLFASAVGDEPFQIYAADVNTGALAKLHGTGSSAQSPDVSSDGSTVVFVGYTVDGYDLFSMRLDASRWTHANPETSSIDLTSSVVSDSNRMLTAEEVGTEQPYSPLRTLAPRFWSPVIESDGDELVIGAATAGGDVLGRHAYAVSTAWAVDRGRPDWWAGYAYDRWWPTLFADVSDDTDAFRDGEIRTREVNAGALFPWRRVRSTQSAVVSFNASREALDCLACSPAAAGRVTRHALRGGWTFQSARSYGYSISREDGSSISLSIEGTLGALGSDADAGAAVLDLRHYLRAAPRHGVIAARVAGAATWGDSKSRRVFSAAGSGPQGVAVEFGADAVGLLRAFDDSLSLGFHVVVANVDYRVPLLRIERGVGTWPFFARTLHAAVFVDAGQAWERRFDANDIKASAGVELSLDAVVGFVLPVTFSAGGAWRHDPAGRERGFAAFGRIGRAF